MIAYSPSGLSVTVTETIAYDVVRSVGLVEIRQYHSLILATVRGRSDNGAFGILFDYISGNNQTRQRIPMTAPVISTGERRERIAMTTPVISNKGEFSFVLPQSYSMDTAPEPLDEGIELSLVPPRKVAVLRFRGRTTEANIQKKTAVLLETLRGAGLQAKGEPFLMRYNPPITPGFLRRNEVGTDII